MIADVNPGDYLRSRLTLRLLLKHLSEVEGPFSIFDGGSGTGMISISLAAHLENVTRVHAMDVSPYAKSRLEANIGKLPIEYRKRAEEKITTQTGSWLSKTDLETAVSQGEFDFSLTCYPAQFMPAVYAASFVIKSPGDLIFAFGTGVSEEESSCNLEYWKQLITSNANEYLRRLGIVVHPLDGGFVDLAPRQVFAIVRITP